MSWNFQFLEEDQPSNEELQCDELDEFKCADGTECILKGDDTPTSKSNNL